MIKKLLLLWGFIILSSSVIQLIQEIYKALKGVNFMEHFNSTYFEVLSVIIVFAVIVYKFIFGFLAHKTKNRELDLKNLQKFSFSHANSTGHKTIMVEATNISEILADKQNLLNSQSLQLETREDKAG